jgi:hypothetical protein
MKKLTAKEERDLDQFGYIRNPELFESMAQGIEETELCMMGFRIPLGGGMFITKDGRYISESES